MRTFVLLLLLLPCLARAQDFLSRDLVVNNRQLQEIRLGSSTFTPPSGIAGSALVSVIVTNGPVAGTTSLVGGVIDGGTLFEGGPVPAFTSIITQGSAFGLGAGCQRGAFTDFPVINQNRPRVARFDAATGTFTLLTPAISGSNSYDSTTCVAKNGVIYFLVSNRTLSRLELYVDNGSGWSLVENIAGVITPFVGGLRPTLAAFGQANALMAVYQVTSGPVLARRIDLVTRGPGASCKLAHPTAPTAFTIVPEAALALLRGLFDTFVYAADINLDGVLDIITFVPGAPCVILELSAPPGSATGANGYNWDGVAIVDALVDEFGVAILFARILVVAPANSAPMASNIPSPVASTGGPKAGCSATLWQTGAGYFAAAPGANNAQMRVVAPNHPRSLFGLDSIAQLRWEANIMSEVKCP